MDTKRRIKGHKEDYIWTNRGLSVDKMRTFTLKLNKDSKRIK